MEKSKQCVSNPLVHLLLRFLTVAVGVIDVILIANSYSTDYNDEIFFCGTTVATFVVSFILLLLHLTGYMDEKLIEFKHADIAFHFVGGLLTFISGMLMMGAAVDRPVPLQSVGLQRTVAAFFGIENGLMYGFIGLLLHRKYVVEKSFRFGEDLEWEDPLLLSQESNKPRFGAI